MVDSYKSSQAALWIQPDGPNTAVYFLGCHDLDDIAESFGGVEYIRKLKPDGSGWEVVTTKQSPPDPVTTGVTTLVFPTRDWIEKIRCPVNLYVLHRCGGNADVFANYVRGQVLLNARKTTRTYSQMVKREEDLESTVAVEFEAEPPLLDVDDLVVSRIASSETAAFNAVTANSDFGCNGDCGPSVDKGDVVEIGADAAGAVTPNGYESVNAGATFAGWAADPLAVSENIGSVIRFPTGLNVYRLAVAKLAAVGTQGKFGYSDDDGATWTSVNIGGAAAGEGVNQQQGLFVWSQQLLLFAGANGSIWRSTDSGTSWTQVEAGVITAGAYHSVSMGDELHGMAVAAGDVIAVTADGGLTWQAAGAVTGSGAALNSVWMLDARRAWVGTANGRLYYTNDFGDTWTRRTGFPADGTGSIRALMFLNDLLGYAIHNTAAPLGMLLRTINGGFTWQAVATPTNAGLNALHFAKQDRGFIVGEPQGGTGVILRVMPAS